MKDNCDGLHYWKQCVIKLQLLEEFFIITNVIIAEQYFTKKTGLNVYSFCSCCFV